MTGHTFGLNRFWLCLVLLHVIGSVVFGVMTILPMGSLCCTTAAWIVYVFITGKKRGEWQYNKKRYAAATAGWAVSAALVAVMPASYAGSMLMNGFMLLFLCYVFQEEAVSVRKTCMVRRIPVIQWPILLLLSVLLFIIAVFVNGVSMLFVSNMVAASLAGSREFFWQSVFVFALLPAVVEELLFRGYIFRNAGGGRAAVVLSAFLFALLHMNFNQMGYGFVMGLFLAVIAQCTENLSTTMVVHFLFNLFNIVIAAFPEHPVLSAILRCNWNGYYFFLPSLAVEGGTVNAATLCTGAATAIICTGIAAGLFLWMKKMKESKIPEKNGKNLTGEGKGHTDTLDADIRAWTPDQNFVLGCAACMIVAVSYELL